MNDPDRPAPQTPPEETLEERIRRLERQRVRPEDEERKSPDGPHSQISPDVEPAGS